MPDEELWNLAVAEKLSDEAVYKAQATRLLKHELTQSSIKEFYSDYLQSADFLQKRMDRMNADPAFKHFAGTNLPS